MSYCVYKHTCINGKVYIGITCQKPQKRWLSGRGYVNNEHFFRAIVKYGWKNIKHEILFDGLTKEEAEQKEIELIAQYKSNDSKYGYNKSSGGENAGAGVHQIRSEESKRKQSIAMSGRKASEETKLKMSETRKGKKHSKKHPSTKGHHQPPHTEEWKQALSKRMLGENNPNYNKKMSEEQKKKISEQTKNKQSVIAVSKLDGTKIIFESAMQGEKETGAYNSNIIACCKGKKKSAKGYYWHYFNSEYQRYIK